LVALARAAPFPLDRLARPLEKTLAGFRRGRRQADRGARLPPLNARRHPNQEEIEGGTMKNRMITRRSFARTVATAGATLALAPAILTRRAEAAEFTLKYANNQPLSHPMNIRAKEAVDAIREQSKGRLEIQIFPNNQLGGDTDMLSQVRSGAVDYFTTSGLIVQTIVPVAGANGVGFAFKDYDTVWAAMDGEFGAHMRQSMLKANIVTMEKAWDNGFRQTTSSVRAINTPEDFKGFKIRIPVMPILTSLFETFGAAPTGINIKEAYSALQTHLVDGQENPLSLIENWKFYEVQKYCSLTNHIWDGWWMLANRRSWEKLPKDLQEIVAGNWNEAALKERTDIRQLNESLQSQLESRGMAFNKPDAEVFRKKLRDGGFYAKWRDTFGAETWALLEKYSGKLA
jgi:tripartite ATP-independent transporter DctP family solute receptor